LALLRCACSTDNRVGYDWIALRRIVIAGKGAGCVERHAGLESSRGRARNRGLPFVLRHSRGSYSQIIDVGNTTIATVSNLAAGLTYYFVVTDYNTVGLESAPSNPVSLTATPNGPSPSGPPPSNPPPTNTGSTGKDFNGDGYADLVFENTASGGRVIWFLVNGVYTSSISLATVSPTWHIAGVGDFLGNGQADLVWENTVTGERLIWILNSGVYAYVSVFPLSPHSGTSWITKQPLLRNPELAGQTVRKN
jgi:hypothetical protein